MVSPAAVVVHPRSAAELAPHDDRCRLQQARGVEVFDHRAQTSVQRRQLLAELNEILAVRIPAAPTEAYDSHAAFDQPPGDQESTVVLMFRDGITLANFFVGLFPIERVGQFAGRDDARRALVECIHRVHHVAGIDIAANAIQLAQQRRTVVEPIRADLGAQTQVRAAFAVGTKARIRRPQETGTGVAREVHERRNGSGRRSLNFRHGAAQAGMPADASQIIFRPAAFGLVRCMFVANAGERAARSPVCRRVGRASAAGSRFPSRARRWRWDETRPEFPAARSASNRTYRDATARRTDKY